MASIYWMCAISEEEINNQIDKLSYEKFCRYVIKPTIDGAILLTWLEPTGYPGIGKRGIG